MIPVRDLTFKSGAGFSACCGRPDLLFLYPFECAYIHPSAVFFQMISFLLPGCVHMTGVSGPPPGNTCTAPGAMSRNKVQTPFWTGQINGKIPGTIPLFRYK